MTEDARDIFESYFTNRVVGELLPAEQSVGQLRDKYLGENAYINPFLHIFWLEIT